MSFVVCCLLGLLFVGLCCLLCAELVRVGAWSFVICGLLFVVCGLLFDACCLLFVVCWDCYLLVCVVCCVLSWCVSVVGIL